MEDKVDYCVVKIQVSFVHRHFPKGFSLVFHIFKSRFISLDLISVVCGYFVDTLQNVSAIRFFDFLCYEFVFCM